MGYLTEGGLDRGPVGGELVVNFVEPTISWIYRKIISHKCSYLRIVEEGVTRGALGGEMWRSRRNRQFTGKLRKFSPINSCI